MPFSVKKASVFPIYETLFPQILIYMENDNDSYGKIAKARPLEIMPPEVQES